MEEDIDAGMYKKTVTANGCLSKWNALLVLLRKPYQVLPHFTFYHHFVYEDIPASLMEAATYMYNLLSIPSNQWLFSADIKYGYCVVNKHPNERQYPTFHNLRIG